MPSKKLPLISVLVPTYNRAATFLPSTIKSVQRQREKGFEHELIIIDNASTDDTKKVVAEFAKQDPRIKYIRNRKNVKASGALEVGLKAARGEYIYPLDDDDMLLARTLQNSFNFLSKNKKIDWCYGFALHCDEDNRLLNRKWATYERKTPKQFFAHLMRGNIVPSGSVMMRKSAAKKAGGWDGVLAAQDRMMWLNLAHAGQQQALLPNYQVIYRLHENRESSRNNKNGLWAQVREYVLKKFGTTEAEVEKEFKKLKEAEPIWY